MAVCISSILYTLVIFTISGMKITTPMHIETISTAHSFIIHQLSLPLLAVCIDISIFCFFSPSISSTAKGIVTSPVIFFPLRYSRLFIFRCISSNPFLYNDTCIVASFISSLVNSLVSLANAVFICLSLSFQYSLSCSYLYTISESSSDNCMSFASL